MTLSGYFMSFSRFFRNEFLTETSFMIRLVLYMQLIGKIIYFYYRYFNNLIGEEFLELFMWTMCHVMIFGLDIICIGIYAIYSIVHIYIFQLLHNDSSYGNYKNELQYIINYSLIQSIL